MTDKKILVFAGSNSKASINKQLAYYVADQMEDFSITKIDLNDYEMPLYGIDREREEGIPEKAFAFRKLVEEHDGIILSLAEHNGAYTAAFKNLFDWISRIKGATWGDKPILLMATSPGGRGGASVLEIAAKRFPRNGGKVVASFSLPFFNENFQRAQGLTNPENQAILNEALQTFRENVLQREVLDSKT